MKRPPGPPAWFVERAQERLVSDFHGGDWSVDPWWLRAKHEKWFAENGWPFERRNAVVPALKRLYPPSVCRELLPQPWHGGVVYFLFQEYLPWFIIPMLKAAEDMGEVSGHKDKRLLRALRNRDTFSSAAFELSVWANLSRHEYRPEREPKTEKGTRPDFAVVLDHRRYLIELKILRTGEIADLADEVSETVFYAQNNLVEKGRNITFSPSEAFRALTRDDRDAVRARLPALAEAVRTLSEHVLQLEHPEGQWEVGEFGTMAIEHTAPGEGGWLRADLVPSLSREEQAGRCMAAIRTALHQLDGSGRGWIVVAVDRGFEAPREVYEAIRRELGADPSKNWDAVILLGWAQTDEGRMVRQVASVHRERGGFTDRERRMLSAMISSSDE